MASSNLPEWLLSREAASLRSDRDAFIDKSIGSFLRLLSRMRAQAAEPEVQVGFHAVVKLVSALFLILLLSLSRSILFIAAAAATILVLLSLCRAELILKVLKAGFPAAVFTFLVMFPSALWGNLPGAVVITIKVFLCVTVVKLMASTTAWSAITRALKIFRVPDILILVLDVTIRYIALLGEMSLEMLYALKLRSVGRNPDKTSSLSGIPGTLYLKSREAVENLSAAMECRCFTGTFKAGPSSKLSAVDAVLFALDAALMAAFLATVI